MTGVLPSQKIKTMIDTNQIILSNPIDEDQIQPASLDLRLGNKAYRVRASFLAGSGNTVTDRLNNFKMHEINLQNGAVLEKGCVYVVPLMESLSLPESINAVANAKSSTGRLDLFTRCITDHGIEFDRIEKGYKGPLYAEISPRSFSVLVKPGMRLNQIRFREGKSVLSDDELSLMHKSIGLVDSHAQIDQGLGFSVDLDLPNGLVGYRAKPHTGLINLDNIDYYDIDGFFDPGFGNADAGGKGSRGVLEVRCHEAPFALEHGQSVGRLVYEKMSEIPDVLYGSDLKSNYQGQGLKLSKHFKKNK